jgi:myosin V
MESDVKVQRQALLSSPVKSMSEHLSIPIAPKVQLVVLIRR